MVKRDSFTKRKKFFQIGYSLNKEYGMSKRDLFKTPTLGGKVFWTDEHEYRNWRIQYNKTLDSFSPLKPFRLLDPQDRLIASADKKEELLDALPEIIKQEESLLAQDYSDYSFWNKVRDQLGRLGRELLLKVFTLYYLMESEDTPSWAKTTCMGALAYFILPVDLIPDVLVPIGYTDDAAMLAYAIITLAAHITPEIKQKAEDQVRTLLD